MKNIRFSREDIAIAIVALVREKTGGYEGKMQVDWDIRSDGIHGCEVLLQEDEEPGLNCEGGEA